MKAFLVTQWCGQCLLHEVGYEFRQEIPGVSFRTNEGWGVASRRCSIGMEYCERPTPHRSWLGQATFPSFAREGLRALRLLTSPVGEARLPVLRGLIV
jgi:hypothetical protein